MKPADTGTGVEWLGLKEFYVYLDTLPDELAVQSDRIAESWATQAVFQIRSAYGDHAFSGNLRDHVEMEKLRYGYGVRSKAKHAWLFEHGSVARFYTGVDKLDRVYDHAPRGTMPAANVFVPIAIRLRNRMNEEFADLLRRHGFEVIVGTAA